MKLKCSDTASGLHTISERPCIRRGTALSAQGVSCSVPETEHRAGVKAAMKKPGSDPGQERSRRRRREWPSIQVGPINCSEDNAASAGPGRWGSLPCSCRHGAKPIRPGMQSGAAIMPCSPEFPAATLPSWFRGSIALWSRDKKKCPQPTGTVHILSLLPKRQKDSKMAGDYWGMWI